MSEISESLKMHVDYTTAGLNAASVEEILECADMLRNMYTALVGFDSTLQSAAYRSGTRNNKTRSIRGKAPIGPLADINEPDADFKHWCDLGSLICTLTRTRDIFARYRREVLSAAYRSGKSINEVIDISKKHPNAYQPGKGTGAYFKFTH